MTACLLHVDMDAFYAAVATRDDPELAARPVIIGGGDRGVVLCANYPARRYGVHSAMPMTRARRMCPQAEVVTPDYTLFESVSASVMEIFRRVTPHVEPLSLDEAFLDLTGTARRLGGPERVAEHIRALVADEQRVTCSVGVAASHSVAKLASKRAKPDGVVVVPPARVAAFVHPLDVGELWGIGEKTRAQLHRLGLVTAGDVAHTPREVLQRALGPHAGAHVHALAWGEDGPPGPGGAPRRPRGFWPGGSAEPERSVGAQETFGRDTDDPDVVRRELLRLSARVTSRMRLAEVVGRTVTITVRFSDFTTLTRSRTLGETTDVTAEVYDAAVRLYQGLGLQRARVRLVGVRVEGLRPRAGSQRQLALGERERGWSEADRAVDRAVARFGSGTVRPAALLGHHPRAGVATGPGAGPSVGPRAGPRAGPGTAAAGRGSAA